jgi:lysophospholipase L1-like esterase
MRKFLSVIFLAFCCAVVFAGEAGPAVSIIGDSYSTFRGVIPEGNAAWYPNNKTDVQRAEECWWSLVISKLGGKLEKNESWSGSTVCYTGYNGSNASRSSFVRRADRLGNPDMIFICGATNDAWAGSPVGEYKWSDWSEQDLFSFRPAMAKMLNDIKVLYPEAKVFFVLNDDLRAVINDSVHDICKHYGVHCVDLKQIDKKSGHPSVKGMKQMADQILESIGRK